jgi:hypothetical protein
MIYIFARLLRKIDGTARPEPSLKMAYAAASTQQYNTQAHHTRYTRRRMGYRYHLHLEARV